VIRRYVNSLIPVFAGWDGNVILTVVISRPEEIPATTCVEGYGPSEI